ncbi:MAG: Asp-tRNA(Asn)/Glu-tRNA(Gln) amidotransferase subunit GatC [Acidobacteria bacterium]|nr:Asp-tRNA(Asn)/Glu-tRNA(Gln) amidotransferase subunit GatC [Acidobacteriota bacterium]
MALTREEVLKVGTLSRIRLSDEEVERFSSQLSSILDYVNKLGELDTRGVEPLAHALPVHNVLRPDEPRPGIGTQKALAGVPESAGDFFRVPRVLDEGSGA